MRYDCAMIRVHINVLVTALSALALACAQKESQPLPSQSSPQPAKVETSLRSKEPAVILAGVSEKTRAEIAKSPVAVLWPGTGLAGAVFVGEPVFYSVSGYQDQTLPNGETSRATITVQGTRATHNEEPVDVSKIQNVLAHGQRAHITRNEEIVTVTWVEAGIYYSVDVECSRNVDERCTRDAFVREIADGLVRLGGAQ
jgi:hypothetical protein